MSLGSHLIFDIENTEYDLNNLQKLKESLEIIMKKQNFSIVGELDKKFEPQGVTMVQLLEESHLSIHTWPETKQATLDLYHCLTGARDVLENFAEDLKELFGKHSVVTSFQLDRGIPTRALNREADNGFTALFPGVKTLHTTSSAFQTIEVLEHPWFGRALVLDSVLQFCARFNDVQSAAVTDRVVKNASNNQNFLTRTLMNMNLVCSKPLMNLLIIGGGDGRITYQMKNNLMDAQIGSVKVVEIDKKVSDVCRDWFADIVTLDDRKYEQIQQDAIEWVKRSDMDNQFDGIIIDSTDPSVGISAGLFSVEFQSNLKRILKPGAMVSQQCDTNAKWQDTLKPIFEQSKLKFIECKKIHTVEYTGETQVLYFKN